MQPGETLTPGQSSQPAPITPTPPEPEANWQFSSETPTNNPTPSKPRTEETAISWSASEFIVHHKSPAWYLGLIATAIALTVLALLLTKDKITAVMIILAVIIFAVIAHRQPRTLKYNISHDGLTIGEKFYPFQDFKSFSVLDEEAMSSILLLPMKRFMPGLSLYYPPDQEDDIMGVLSLYLPLETRPVDLADRLARKLRF